MSKHLHIHVHDSAYNYNGTFNKKDVVQNNKKHYYVTYNGIHKLTTTTKVPDAACGCTGDAEEPKKPKHDPHSGRFIGNVSLRPEVEAAERVINYLSEEDR